MARVIMDHLLTKLLFLLVLNLSLAVQEFSYKPQYFQGEDLQHHLHSVYHAHSMVGATPHLQGQQEEFTGVSAQCAHQLMVLDVARLSPENYTWIHKYDNADARGTFPTTGALLGRLDATGSFDQCLQVYPTWDVVYLPDLIGNLHYIGLHNFSMIYCKARYRTKDSLNSFSEGWCLPDSCDRNDVISMMKNENLTDFPVHESYCGTKPPLKTNTGGIVALTICCFFGALILVATIFDGTTQWLEDQKKSKITSADVQVPPINSDKPHQDSSVQGHTNLAMEHESTSNGLVRRSVNNVGESTKEIQTSLPLPAEPPREAEKPSRNVAVRALLSFSLFTTIPMVVRSDSNRSTYRSINGLRVFAMMWIVLGHTWTLYTSNASHPYAENLLVVPDLQARFSHQIIKNMNLGADIFFLLSGALVTVTFLNTLDRNEYAGVLGWIREMVLYVLHRYLRLTPLFAALMMIVTPLWQYFGHGPNFPDAFPGIDGCKQVWWVNLLYIQNFYRGDTAGCFNWAWYLANDFQYYLIVPVFAVVLYKTPFIGGVFLALGWVGSLVARIVLILRTSASDFAWVVYVKPWTRFGPYAQGILLGFLIYRTRCKIRMHWALALLGWAVAIALGILMVFGTQYKDSWNDTLKNVHTVVFRDVFALAIAWVVFACVTGYGGLINTFLSWNFFIQLSKLTYCGFLIHPIIHYITLASQQQLISIRDLDMSSLYIGNLVLTFLCSLGLTLVFEVPFMALEKAIIPRKK